MEKAKVIIAVILAIGSATFIVAFIFHSIFKAVDEVFERYGTKGTFNRKDYLKNR